MARHPQDTALPEGTRSGGRAPKGPMPRVVVRVVRKLRPMPLGSVILLDNNLSYRLQARKDFPSKFLSPNARDDLHP